MSMKDVLSSVHPLFSHLNLEFLSKKKFTLFKVNVFSTEH